MNDRESNKLLPEDQQAAALRETDDWEYTSLLLPASEQARIEEEQARIDNANRCAAEAIGPLSERVTMSQGEQHEFRSNTQ